MHSIIFLAILLRRSVTTQTKKEKKKKKKRRMVLCGWPHWRHHGVIVTIQHSTHSSADAAGALFCHTGVQPLQLALVC
jgi:hypothetical protein